MSTSPTTPLWICVQAGHRERYAIPRALARMGALERLVTDVWVRPGSLLDRLGAGGRGRRLRDRYHSDLATASIAEFTTSTLAWELRRFLLRSSADRDPTVERNAWWSRTVQRSLPRLLTARSSHLFSYCYDALPVFETARDLGLDRVLGQIDPGPVEDRKVANLVQRWSQFQTSFRPGSSRYYDDWRRECGLASRIIVNSRWSQSALIADGIDPARIEICPLVYDPPPEAATWQRDFPASFSSARPLRILFLGQCILRKGIAETIEAARALRNLPVEFTFVGNTDIENFSAHLQGARIRHLSRISRAECHAYYRAADIFLFPTHSDGFGLTQLEAQAWRLPVIASTYCGEVVEPGRTGWILPEVSAHAIGDVVREILDHPEELERRSPAIARPSFSLETLGRQLAAPWSAHTREAVSSPLVSSHEFL